MRVTLKHILPLALVLTGVAAQKDSNSKDVSTETEDVATTTEKAEATTTNGDEEEATETGKSDSKSDSKEDDKSSKDESDSKTASKDDGKDSSKKATATVDVPSSVGRYTFEATMPATTAPDINAAGRFSARDSSFLALTVAVGAVTFGAAFL